MSPLGVAPQRRTSHGGRYRPEAYVRDGRMICKRQAGADHASWRRQAHLWRPRWAPSGARAAIQRVTSKPKGVVRGFADPFQCRIGSSGHRADRSSLASTTRSPPVTLTIRSATPSYTSLGSRQNGTRTSPHSADLAVRASETVHSRRHQQRRCALDNPTLRTSNSIP